MRSIAANELIGENLASFTRGQLNRDGFIDIYLHTPGGAVSVGGGSVSSQTISSLPISASDQQFFQDIVLSLDQRLDAEFRFTSDKEVSDIQLYYDSEINLGGDILGLAMANNEAGRDWWELFINKPAFGADLNHLRYSLIHELGHALGLEHPFDNTDGDVVDGITDPWTSAYPEDTVMAYRSPSKGSWPNAYTVNDLEALVSIWGAETQVFSNQSEQIFGEDYSEVIIAAGGDDALFGAGGNDDLLGGIGFDLVRGGPGDDVVRGGKNADQLYGGRGNDLLRGGRGHDQLKGGVGDDLYWGGPGADLFRFSSGNDSVFDFNIADADCLGLEAGLSYSIAQQGNDLLVQTSLGTITLMGINISEFDVNTQIIMI
ncbi:hypothetical protein [Prochlorococcus marinus]|uniref:Serralysin n=1 Tax=Prochlorococcus marinus (strain MIT 9303) TaxID=59922 RepID=A2C5U0_PROM3|nr:hypothetical protein [Prochlorococcus marinus]ABM76850.1 Hypothetical protein P9303_00951 [Prochlorococcus marinus str. MIT 9303]